MPSLESRSAPPEPLPLETVPGSSGLPVQRSIGVGLAALAAGHFAVDCCSGIWPVYKTLASLDLAKAGFIATAYGVLGNVLQVAFGILADRGFAKTLLVSGVILAGAVTLVPYASSYPVLFLLALTTAIGSAAFHPVGAGSASSLSRQRTGVLVALFLMGGNLGYSLSQLLFTAIYRTEPRATVILAVIPILVATGIARVVSRPDRVRQSLGDWGRTVHQAWRSLIPLFAVQVFAAAISNALVFLLPDFMALRGASPQVVGGGGHFALVLGTCLALVPAGHAADRFGARRVLVVTTILSGILLTVLLRFQMPTIALLLLVAAFGASNNATTVVVVSEGNRMLPGQVGGVSALLMGLPWGVAAISPAIAGTLANPLAGGTPDRALSWLSLCIPAAICSCWFMRRRSATQRSPHPPPSADPLR